MDRKTKPTWGGRRKGAGRKQLVKDGCSLSIWIPRNLRKQLDIEAKKRGETRSAFLRHIFEGVWRDFLRKGKP